MEPVLPPTPQQVCCGCLTFLGTVLRGQTRLFLETYWWPHLCLTRPAPKGLIFNLFKDMEGSIFGNSLQMVQHIPLGT